MRIIYNLSIALYTLFAILMSPFNLKARLWYGGRKGFFKKWKDFDSGGRRVIWFHCASLGEFEQGRPVIEEIKRRDPGVFILLSFFSPSGYEIRKDYPLAGAVCYLPADNPSNARRFIRKFNPCAAVFIKNEFWRNYISELSKNKIPVYLVSAGFRPGQIFFRWYGGWFLRILRMFSHIFVQDESSVVLLDSAGICNVSVAGDTRFDRVYALAAERRSLAVVESFSEGCFTIVAGSTWPPDNALLSRFINETAHDVNLIIAPHEIDEEGIQTLAGQFRKPALRYSRAGGSDIKAFRILIIDNIGMLSSLYYYGDLAYIGGGFGVGIHNILEACTYGIPVIFGPNYRKSREARELSGLGGAFSIENFTQLLERLNEMLVNKEMLTTSGKIAKSYVQSGVGATIRIVDKILIF